MTFFLRHQMRVISENLRVNLILHNSHQFYPAELIQLFEAPNEKSSFTYKEIKPIFRFFFKEEVLSLCVNGCCVKIFSPSLAMLGTYRLVVGQRAADKPVFS